MILYRIARKEHADDLTGIGGLLSSARWHDHMPIIYMSISSSTAVLEKLVHMSLSDIHHDLMMIEIEVPDTIAREKIEIPELPTNWRDYPAPEILKNYGNAWLVSKSALLLQVPSAIDPNAINVLINPAHKDLSYVKIIDMEKFEFSPRLAKLVMDKI